MRSAKDLKEIVTGSRAKSKMNGIAGNREYPPGANDGDNTTAAEDDEGNYNKENKRKGGWEQKFKGPGGFGRSDSTAGDGGDLKAVNFKLERELDDLKQKFGVMRRNYESMASYAHTDKAEFAKVKAMKDKYEATIAQLKTENTTLKGEV